MILRSETRWVQATAMLFALCLSTGCATRDNSNSGTGAGSQPVGSNYAYLTGNWKLTAKDSSAGATASPDTLSGVVYEQGGDTLPHFATSVLRSTSSCYTGANIIPLDGSVNSSSLQLASFSVLGQVLTLAVQKDASAQTLTGTYSIAGGTCGGRSGTLTGQRYATVNGNYTGTFGSDGQRSAALALAQNESGSGEGFFVLTGSASFSGIPCFSSGVVDSTQSFVSGSDVVLAVTAKDATTVLLNGTVDPAAKTILLQTTTVVSGSCSSTFSGGTLTRT